ncbi:MAG: sulfurtransferase FdhD [Marinomonas sp.]|nr:MAG: sulfurtransferase FdhD [Marinomonas sp.]
MASLGTVTNSYMDSHGLHETELVQETPIAISINDVNYAVIMVTDVDVEAFVTGFAFSEGLINQASEILDIEFRSSEACDPLSSPHHILANLVLTNRALQRSRSIMRQRRGASGCGLCGIEAVEQAFPKLTPYHPIPTLSDDKWLSVKANFPEHQVIGQASGAIHGAMLLDKSGEIVAFAEDIGRHNALDKLIGKAMIAQHALKDCHILMSSRCSTELIMKATRTQVASLAHLASPSHLAVQQAKQLGLHLIHLPRHAPPRHFN